MSRYPTYRERELACLECMGKQEVLSADGKMVPCPSCYPGNYESEALDGHAGKAAS